MKNWWSAGEIKRQDLFLVTYKTFQKSLQASQWFSVGYPAAKESAGADWSKNSDEIISTIKRH